MEPKGAEPEVSAPKATVGTRSMVHRRARVPDEERLAAIAPPFFSNGLDTTKYVLEQTVHPAPPPSTGRRAPTAGRRRRRAGIW